jgi:hypothetical protein
MHNICESRVIVSAFQVTTLKNNFQEKIIKTMCFQYSSIEAPNSCCVYNMTHMTLNNEKMLGCAKVAHDANKSEIQPNCSFLLVKIIHFELLEMNPSTGVKYWTSGKWSKACNKYVWCPDKEILGDDAKWKKDYPKAGNGDCLGIYMGSSKPENNGLFNGKCSEQTNFFCIGVNI